jgi:hypothetical protein
MYARMSRLACVHKAVNRRRRNTSKLGLVRLYDIAIIDPYTAIVLHFVNVFRIVCLVFTLI